MERKQSTAAWSKVPDLGNQRLYQSMCVQRMMPCGWFFNAQITHRWIMQSFLIMESAAMHKKCLLSTIVCFCTWSPGGMKRWIRMRASAGNSCSGRQATRESVPFIAVITATERLSNLQHVVLPEGMGTWQPRSSLYSAGTVFRD